MSENPATPEDQQARIAEIRERWSNATDVPLTAIRYEHGGGRLYVDGDRRQLVLDAYEEGDREFYFNAYADMGELFDALASAQAAQPSPCEWRSASPGGPIVWSGCIDKWDQRWMQRHAIKDWKACPYCAAPLTLAEVPHV